MAKKTKEENNISVDYREQIRKSIISKYGENISKEASILNNEKKIIIPLSPALDRGLNGGVPEGSWCIFSGPPKMGKTTLALQLAANAQKEEYGNKTIYYIDVEGRFKKMNLSTVNTLNQDKFELIRSEKGKILSAEDFLTIAMDIIKGHPECVVIVDSTSALCAAKELGEDIKSSGRNEGPKLLAAFCRQMANVVPVNNTIVILIQHLIANTSGYGPTMMEDGGNKVKYQVDVKLRGKGAEKWLNTNDEQIGQIAKWDITTSALGAPSSTVESYIRYGYGIDDIMEIIQLSTDFGVINKAGAWYSFDYNGEEVKAQGIEKLHAKLLENKELLSYINSKVSVL